tara:strand:- start:1003 stop:1257 length:255 start_codon:yes stop_codon:yes gene_type:complete
MYFNYSRFFVVIFLFSISFSQFYDIGDQITLNHQAIQHDVCYGAEYHGIEQEGGRYKLSLDDYNGYINDSGIFYVIMIDMAASW